MSPQARTRLLYQLEDEELPKGCIFSSLDEARTFANFVAVEYSFRYTECPRVIQVKCNGERDCSEAIGPNTIWLCRDHWCAAVVLHELAHFLAPPKAETHGEEFIACYLHLLTDFMGAAYDRIYKEAFIRNGLMKG